MIADTIEAQKPTPEYRFEFKILDANNDEVVASGSTYMSAIVEDNWGLAPLTHRDGARNNLSQDFDLSSGRRAPDPQPLRTDCKGPALTLPVFGCDYPALIRRSFERDGVPLRLVHFVAVLVAH